MLIIVTDETRILQWIVSNDALKELVKNGTPN